MPNLSCFSGFLSDVKGIAVTSVALGKAHGVLLTNKGQVYTFGLNNKGQCGREFVAGGSSKECKYFFTSMQITSVLSACLSSPQDL